MPEATQANELTGPSDDQRLQQAFHKMARQLVEVRKFDPHDVSLAMMAVATVRLRAEIGDAALSQKLGLIAVALHKIVRRRNRGVDRGGKRPAETAKR